jgi:hypothetical protein
MTGARQAPWALLAMALAGCATAGDKAVPETIAPPSPAEIVMHRQKIASMIEESGPFRGLFDDHAPRLRNAVIKGPVLMPAYGSLSRRQPYILYCVTADQMVLGALPGPRSAMATITRGAGPNGMDKISLVTFQQGEGLFSTCSRDGGPDQPFPELIEARTKRRQALGKEP